VTPKSATEMAAVAASAPVTLATAGVSQTMISLAVGLIGVWLARTVFVNRENRRLSHNQPVRETLPITLAACLIAGAVIWDRELSISTSAFLGLGVGWTTVVILELFGDNAINALRVLTGRVSIAPHGRRIEREVMPTTPDDMTDLLRQADDKAPDYKPPNA
jgi:hypothetical protein